MRYRRYEHSCVVWKEELVVMGGRGHGARTSVEVLNIATRQWRKGPSLPRSFYWGQALEYQSTLFAVYRDGLVIKLLDNETWQEVSKIGSIGRRPVYPAPLLTPAILRC